MCDGVRWGSKVVLGVVYGVMHGVILGVECDVRKGGGGGSVVCGEACPCDMVDLTWRVVDSSDARIMWCVPSHNIPPCNPGALTQHTTMVP